MQIISFECFSWQKIENSINKDINNIKHKYDSSFKLNYLILCKFISIIPNIYYIIDKKNVYTNIFLYKHEVLKMRLEKMNHLERTDRVI